MGLSKQRSSLITTLRQQFGLAYGTVADAMINRSLDAALRRFREREWNSLHGTAVLQTTAPFEAGTVVVEDPVSDGILTFSATLPAAVAGQWIEINGEREWYQIQARDGDNQATLNRPYIGATAHSTAVSFRILFPLVNLPSNFRRLGDIWESNPWFEMRLADVAAIHKALSWQAEVSQPRNFSIPQGHNDPNQMQMMFYPAPDAVRAYHIYYSRDPGWFAGSDPLTAIWKVEATLDTDYLDWPDRFMDVFYRAAAVALYEESDKENKLGQAMVTFNNVYEEAKKDDSRWPALGSLKGSVRGQRVGRGGLYVKTTENAL